MAEESVLKRPAEDPEAGVASGKRSRVDSPIDEQPTSVRPEPPVQADATPAAQPEAAQPDADPFAVSKMGLRPTLPEMPPSLELVTGVKADMAAKNGLVGEAEVGIRGYAGEAGLSGLKGVIKQRYAFPVFLPAYRTSLIQLGSPTSWSLKSCPLAKCCT